MTALRGNLPAMLDMDEPLYPKRSPLNGNLSS